MSKLISGISRVLRKSLEYFNGTNISTFFALLISEVFSVILILDLNDPDRVISSFGSSL